MAYRSNRQRHPRSEPQLPSVPRQERLAQMAAQLLHAAKAQDWAALEVADQTLAEQLPQLAAQGDWSAAERTVLQGLAQAHSAARNAAAAAGDALAERLAQLQSGRDGWLAYAMNESTYP